MSRVGKVQLVSEQGRPLGTIEKLMEGQMFTFKYLRVGVIAMEIEGEDIDGVKFKLSDYRGKVTVLDFWGNW